MSKLNIDTLNMNKLNEIKNNLLKDQGELIIKQEIITKQLKQIKQQMCIECKEEFGEHSWIKEKEDSIYGQTYIYCSRCGKDKYSNMIYDI